MIAEYKRTEWQKHTSRTGLKIRKERSRQLCNKTVFMRNPDVHNTVLQNAPSHRRFETRVNDRAFYFSVKRESSIVRQ